MRPRLLLISGLPGAGKTSLARALEQRVPAVRLDGDTWMLELGIDLHDEAVRARLEVLFWQLSQHLLSLGQSVILESGFWLREDRDEKRLGARALGAGVELHYLDVPFEKRWNRVSRRNREPIWCRSPITYDQLAGWDQYFEPPSTSELALFDPPSAIGDAAGDAWPHASEFPPT